MVTVVCIYINARIAAKESDNEELLKKVDTSTPITLYPVPVLDKLKGLIIDKTWKGALLSLINMEGKKIKHLSEVLIGVNDQEFELNLGSLASGIYIIEIINSERNVYKKKIIKK